MTDTNFKDIFLSNYQKEILDRLSDYSFYIGVIDGRSKEQRLSRIGLTNADLLAILSEGSPINNIVPRPILDITIKTILKKKMLDKALDECIDGILTKSWKWNDVEKYMNITAIRFQSLARNIIYSNDGRLARNKPSTIKAKGFNHPLFQTGQLARSIVCIFSKNEIQNN